MPSPSNYLATLAERAAQGDVEALAEVRRLLGRHLGRIVRRSLDEPDPAVPLARWIHNVADARRAGLGDDPRQQAEQVARSIRHTIVQRLKQQADHVRSLRETVTS
ncbi:MAG TPA: hypothetical protein VNK04_06920 [Gemmataceae bacterium]|jgi:hypothetical protein|nr:hypothetical protein [Gemmataceae bacterium]